MSFVVSVLPAPDSPQITIAWHRNRERGRADRLSGTRASGAGVSVFFFFVLFLFFTTTTQPAKHATRQTLVPPQRIEEVDPRGRAPAWGLVLVHDRYMTVTRPLHDRYCCGARLVLVLVHELLERVLGLGERVRRQRAVARAAVAGRRPIDGRTRPIDRRRRSSVGAARANPIRRRPVDRRRRRDARRRPSAAACP